MTTPSHPTQQSLAEVAKAATQLLLEADGQTNVYRTLISSIEKPMLEAVMKHANDNQSQASQILGINRATLRNRLRLHNLI